MIRRFICWALVPILLGVGLSACSTFTSYNAYPGTERPDAEVAVVEGSFSVVWLGLLIIDTRESFRRFDGEAIEFKDKLGGANFVHTIRLLPGRHRLEFVHKTIFTAGISQSPGEWPAYCLLEQNFLAGHSYKIKAHSLEKQGSEISTNKIYPATIDLEVSSPNAVELVTTPVICREGLDSFGEHFCKADEECNTVFIKKESSHRFSDFTEVPARCVIQAGYEYGLCEAVRALGD